MLQRSNEPLLGMEGYPAERSMYESVLASTGLHRKLDGGVWGFAPPTRSPKHNLSPTWRHLSEVIFARQPEPISLDALFAELADPPYGIMDGFHPVLLCAFILVYAEETTLYRDGTFLPEPAVADFEVLMRRPELFAIAGCRVEGGRAAVVERLSKGLKVKPTTVAVVRALFQMVRALPEFAWRTRRLSETTIAVRQGFENAKSPERFLFVELPQALGLPEFSQRKPAAKDITVFFNTLNHNLQQWAKTVAEAHEVARDVLLESCGFALGELGWHELRQRCVQIEPTVTEPGLLAFVKRVIHADADQTGVESVLALVASRPPHNWSDADLERFPGAAKAIGRAFQNAAHFAGGQAIAPDKAIDALPPRERKEARELLAGLRKHVTSQRRQRSTRVIHAALAELMREIAEH